MDFFTRAWALGDMSDEDAEGVTLAYQAYIDGLDRDTAVWRFATTIGLNDAYIDRVAPESEDIRLQLLTGDNQRGYWHTDMVYRNARVIHGHEALMQAVVNRPTEIWYDEFSGAPSEMIHRFLLVKAGDVEDRGEVHIAFTAFEYSETPAQDRELTPL